MSKLDVLQETIMSAVRDAAAETGTADSFDVRFAIAQMRAAVALHVNAIKIKIRSAQEEKARAEVRTCAASTLGRLSVDGTVRLPEPLMRRLRLKPGDFVHYVEINDEGARIVSAEEFDRIMGAPE